MAVTLAESAKLSQDMLAKGVLETFVQSSPILDRIPFMPIEGNAFSYDAEASLPGVEFRNVNEGYTESTGTVNQKTESLHILGGDADVDTFIQKTRSNLNDQRAEQTVLKTKALSYKFQDTFFNGDTDVDPKGFDGLRKRLRPIFALLQPSFSPFNPLARLPLSNPSSSTKHVSLLLRLSLSLALSSRSVRLVPLRRLLSFIPFVSLSSEFTPLPPRHKHATMLPATAAAHPAYLSELSCHPATRTPTVDRSPP